MKRTALTRKRPMRQVSAKKRAYRASDEGKAASDHMGRVARLPCVICKAWPVQVHHCYHGRYGTRKESDFDTIPLCRACHADIHARKASWAAEHGPDYTYLRIVAQQLKGLDR